MRRTISVFRIPYSTFRSPLTAYGLLLTVCCLLLVAACRQPSPPPAPSGAAQPARIFDVTTSAADGQTAQYSRFQIDFQVDTTAANLQFPYDAAPPPGVPPQIGVTIDALFTPDDWQTIFIQPAFHYQQFRSEVRENRPWIYPTEETWWQARFTPHAPGEWQYRLVVEDANGRYETAPAPFTVVPAAAPGFVRVSADPRYFAFDDGTYFPGLGLNLEMGDYAADFPALAQNGIQLVRTYLPSQFSIWGAAWSPWRSVGAEPPGQETNARLRHDAALPVETAEPLAVPGHELFLWLSHDETVFDDGRQWRHVPCAVLGWNTPPIPVEPQTEYQLRVRYRPLDLIGPKIAERPFGFTVKLSNWLWDRRDETARCTYPGTGRLLAAGYPGDGWTGAPDPDHDGWFILQTTLNSGDAHFLPRLWLAVENAASGSVLVDHVWLQPVDAEGALGPNVIYKASMAQHLYFDQRSSFAFDQVVEAAEAHGVYLKLVVMEKGDYALNVFGPDGALSAQANSREAERLFYGSGREMSKIRWLQQAWWRYLQARWGYAAAIHSWELLNEGSPTSEAHYILADEFGKYMRQAFTPPGQTAPHPNRHLVTTSFWSGFPIQFWGEEAYPHVDYADVHYYARRDDQRPFQAIISPADFDDAAAFSQKLSAALAGRGVGMPIVRGEVGFIFDGDDPFAAGATDGLWLHNMLWAGLNAGGMMELYWTGAPTQAHVVGAGHDWRSLVRPYYNFVRDLPLGNGRYTDAAAVTSDLLLRAWGQQDAQAGQAHLWLQNAQHTWANVAQGAPVSPRAGTVTLGGFRPGATYVVEWWDTRQPDPAQQIARTETAVAGADGALTLVVTDLVGDTAVKIRPTP